MQALRRSGHSAVAARSVSRGDLCRCLHKVSPQALQAVVTLLAQVREETVVQKQLSLQPSRFIVFRFGQHESCNRT